MLELKVESLILHLHLASMSSSVKWDNKTTQMISALL